MVEIEFEYQDAYTSSGEWSKQSCVVSSVGGIASNSMDLPNLVCSTESFQ